MTNRNPNEEIHGWHAHVYFDEETGEAAQSVRDAVQQEFDIEMGRWHARPIGPHPMWSYQIAFKSSVFAEILPWLSLNRAGLTVFVHPETGHDIPDHTDYAIWLGEKYTLNLDALRR